MKIETEIITFFNKSRYFRNFIKDKKLIFSTLLIIFSWAIIYLLLFYKPGYESNSTVWIKNLATEEFVASLDNNSQLTSLTQAGNPVLTQIEILKSKQLKDAVAEYKTRETGKKVDPESIKLDIKNKTNTDMLGISYKGNTPEEAEDTLKEVLKEYENINLSINSKIKTKRREYIDVKLAELENKLKDVRTQIKDYKTKSLAIDIENKPRLLIEQQMQMTTKLEDNLALQKHTSSALYGVQKQLALSPRDALNAVALGTTNQNLITLRENLNEAVQQYEFDSAKYAETNPLMVAQKAKIDTINKQIKKQIELSIGKYAQTQKINIFDPVREDLVRQLIDNQTLLYGLNAEEKSIRNSINKNKLEQNKVPEEKFTLDTLEQEETALSLAYEQLREKQIEAKIKEAEAVSNIVIVDYPNLPEDPSFPTVFQTLILAIFFGLSVGISVSIVKTYMEDICEDTEVIEEITNTSIIGTIPWIDELVPEEQIQQIHGLAYDSIVSNLMIKCYQDSRKVLTFTSSSLKKTYPTIIYQIATRLKKSGHSVIILDSDFRIPTTIKSVGLEEKISTNLSDLIIALERKLLQKQEIVSNREITDAIVTDSLGIDYIGNKDTVFEPYGLYGTKAFEYVIDVLKRKYDWVLIDTGVAHITPEFLIISRLSDGVVLFVNKTITNATIKDIAKQLKNANIPFVGTIIRESGSKLKHEYQKYLDYLKDKFTNQEASA